MKNLLTFLVFVTLAVCSLTTNPGIRLRLTDKGLSYVAKIAVEVLNEKLKTIKIPDVSGDEDTPVGHISYSLSSIEVSSLSIPTYSLKTKVNVGLEMSVSSVSMSMSGHWHYREDHWPHISDSGSFTLSASGISFDVSIKIGATSDGHPTIAAAGCSASIGGVSIHFSGGASWLYNLFSSKIEGVIKSSLNSELCKAATSAINDQGAKAVAKFPVKKQLDKYSLIDYALVKTPNSSFSFLDVFVKGEFESVAHPSEAPFTPVSLPVDSESSSMVYAWITDYVLNSASFVYMQAGFMNRTVTNDDLPKNFSYALNTKTFKLLIPLLYYKYPDRPMKLKVYPTEIPTVSSLAAGIDLSIIGNIEMYVDLANGSSVYALTLGLKISSSVKIAVRETNLTVHSDFVKLKARLIDSAIGNILLNIKLLQVFLDVFVDKLVIKEINEFGDKGFPLPVIDGVSLENPKISNGKSFTLVSADVSYKPNNKEDEAHKRYLQHENQAPRKSIRIV
ncbi:bactericidal permeability-increasing protein-like [Actinia tenebrosa]|uniref:Bactericidal permeability-increasing protein-like n=1 Tax=Actinia tenebrosa TaxID=6105 RepID=A0A6P8IK06_ACTTE|nr:bactericidal permeability-increasing protein-like [Actinia tenebrosa]